MAVSGDVLYGKSATGVILDALEPVLRTLDKNNPNLKELVLEAVTQKIAAHLVKEFVEKHMVKVLHEKQKGPPKRTGGKHTTKWDRWS